MEILVAVGLLGAAAVGVLPALATASKASRAVELRSAAYFIALEQLGESELAVKDPKGLPDTDGGYLRVGPHSVTWLQLAEPLEADPLVYRVDFAVSWPRGAERDKFNVLTLLRKPGPSA